MSVIPTGYQNEIAGPDKKLFECPICLCIIRKATELPCEHLMCSDCLLHYENEEIQRIKRERLNKSATVYRCSICQTPYQRNKKYAVKSVDRIIQRDIPVNCLQKDCTWTGSLQDYEEHKSICLEKVPCQYFDLGCLELVAQRNLKQHNETFGDFHQTLILDNVKLLMKERAQDRERIQQLQSQLEKNDRQLGNLSKELKNQTDRQLNLQKSLEQYNKSLKSIEKEIDDMKIMLKNQTKEYSEKENDRVSRDKESFMKKLEDHRNQIKKQSNKSQQLEKENANLREKLTSQGKRIQQLEEKSLNQGKKDLHKSLDVHSKDISELKTFAEQMSSFLHRLSSWEFMKEKFYRFFRENDYEDDIGLKEWRNFSDKVLSNEENVDCVYLKEMKDAIKGYSHHLYPGWYTRLNLLANKLDTGVIDRHYHLKLYAPCHFDFISVKAFSDVIGFEKEINSYHKWCRYSIDVASYHDSEANCFHVALVCVGVNNIRMFNWFDEAVEIRIPVNGNIVDLSLFSNHSCVDECRMIFQLKNISPWEKFKVFVG
eukprot:TCONS_00016308-protein